MAVKNIKKNINGKGSEGFGNLRILSDKLLVDSVVKCFYFFTFITLFSCSGDDSSLKEVISPVEKIELNEKVCTDFAIKMHTSIMNGDSSFINNYIDWANILPPNLMDLHGTNEMLAYLKMNYSVGTDLIQEVINGGHLKFVTYYSESDSHYIVLRMYEEPQTINYLEFKLNVIDNKLVIQDIYDYQKGRDFSEWLSMNVLFYGKYGKDWYTAAEAVKSKLDSVYAQIVSGELLLAYNDLKGIDGEFQKTLMFADFQEDLLLNSNDPKIIIPIYNKIVSRIPIPEKGRWLSLFYLNALNGKYQDALISLANLESNVGSDGSLDFFKGNMYFELNNYTEALNMFNNALAYDPEIYTFHFAKVLSQIELNQFDQAIESLLVMDDYFDVSNVKWEVEFEAYEDFLRSEQFKRWQERILSGT